MSYSCPIGIRISLSPCDALGDLLLVEVPKRRRIVSFSRWKAPITPVEVPKRRRIVSFSRWKAPITPVESRIPAVVGGNMPCGAARFSGGNHFQAIDTHFFAVAMTQKAVGLLTFEVEISDG